MIQADFRANAEKHTCRTAIDNCSDIVNNNQDILVDGKTVASGTLGLPFPSGLLFDYFGLTISIRLISREVKSV